MATAYKTILLLRMWGSREVTWGHLIGYKYIAATMERSWKGNKVNISCIPAGRYIIRPNATGKHKYFSVQNVPDRTDIEFHPANYPSELQGCIALGDEYDVNGTLTNSRVAMDNFKEFIGNEPFELIIKNLEDL